MSYLEIGVFLFYGMLGVAWVYFCWLLYGLHVERKKLAEKYTRELEELGEEIDEWHARVDKLEGVRRVEPTDREDPK